MQWHAWHIPKRQARASPAIQAIRPHADRARRSQRASLPRNQPVCLAAWRICIPDADAKSNHEQRRRCDALARPRQDDLADPFGEGGSDTPKQRALCGPPVRASCSRHECPTSCGFALLARRCQPFTLLNDGGGRVASHATRLSPAGFPECSLRGSNSLRPSRHPCIQAALPIPRPSSRRRTNEAHR